MSHEPTNADRAAWAKDALAVFAAATFSGRHPDRMERGDLECAVADLLHFAVRQGFDAGSVMNWACGHFGREVLDEASQGLTMLDRGTTAELIESLHCLLEQTVDRDLKYGITLSDGEAEARAKALSAIARAAEALQSRSPRRQISTTNR